MRFFTYEEKVATVKAVEEEGLSYVKAGKRVGASKTVVYSWILLARENGMEALKDRPVEQHTGEFKVKVVEYMHEQHVSPYFAAARFNVARTQVQRWNKIYLEEGREALMEERRGKGSGKKRGRKKRVDKMSNEELMNEVQQLRMENDYLKKLNALVQERISHEKKNISE